MSEDTHDPANPWILNVMIGLSERVLESNTSANILIIVLIILLAIPLLGIGIMTTRAIAPVDSTQVGN